MSPKTSMPGKSQIPSISGNARANQAENSMQHSMQHTNSSAMLDKLNGTIQFEINNTTITGKKTRNNGK